MSNSRYTHIHAFGTPSAFDPSFVQHAQLVGPYHDAALPTAYPFRVIDVNVDVSELKASSATVPLIVLGEPLPPGCVVLYVTLNGNGSINDATFAANVGWADAFPATPTVPEVGEFKSNLVGTAGAAPGIPGTDINGGQADTNPANAVVISSTGGPVYPVLLVTTPAVPPTNPPRVGNVNVKMVVLCP